MREYTDNGLTLRWSEAAEQASGGLRRVFVDAGPAATSHDLLRLVYSVNGGSDRAVRGWPVGKDPTTGLQRFAADLPVPPGGGTLDWRPVLASRGREIDPGPQPTEPAAPGPAADAPRDAARSFEHIAEFEVPFEADFHPLGATPDGVRLRFGIREGGRVRGRRLNGSILPVGGDWMRVRPDGIGILDARALIRPDAGGELIMFEDSGVCDFGRDGYAALLKGKLPPSAPVRLAPRYLTSNPDYLWLNRIQGFAVGEAQLSTISLRFDVYAIEGDARA